jgi:hypothetical protein
MSSFTSHGWQVGSEYGSDVGGSCLVKVDAAWYGFTGSDVFLCLSEPRAVHNFLGALRSDVDVATKLWHARRCV